MCNLCCYSPTTPSVSRETNRSDHSGNRSATSPALVDVAVSGAPKAPSTASRADTLMYARANSRHTLSRATNASGRSSKRSKDAGSADTTTPHHLGKVVSSLSELSPADLSEKKVTISDSVARPKPSPVRSEKSAFKPASKSEDIGKDGADSIAGSFEVVNDMQVAITIEYLKASSEN